MAFGIFLGVGFSTGVIFFSVAVVSVGVTFSGTTGFAEVVSGGVISFSTGFSTGLGLPPDLGGDGFFCIGFFKTTGCCGAGK